MMATAHLCVAKLWAIEVPDVVPHVACGGLPSDWNKNLEEPEDEDFALESETDNVIPAFCESTKNFCLPSP
jgi:hypothetical protein